MRHDCAHRKVGRGKEAFDRAQRALQGWKHMQLGWVDTNRPSLNVGSTLCIVARVVCCWMRNPLQIVYVNDDQSTRQLVSKHDRGNH